MAGGPKRSRAGGRPGPRQQACLCLAWMQSAAAAIPSAVCKLAASLVQGAHRQLPTPPWHVPQAEPLMEPMLLTGKNAAVRVAVAEALSVLCFIGSEGAAETLHSMHTLWRVVMAGAPSCAWMGVPGCLVGTRAAVVLRLHCRILACCDGKDLTSQPKPACHLYTPCLSRLEALCCLGRGDRRATWLGVFADHGALAPAGQPLCGDAPGPAGAAAQRQRC